MSLAPETLPRLLEGAAERFASLEALGVRRGAHFEFLSYGELSDRVDRLRASLSALGVDRGDRVALISDNCPAWVVCAFATFGLGAVLVPMYEAQSPEDWRHILDDSQTSVVFCRGERALAAVQELKTALPTLRHVFSIEGPAEREGTCESLLARGSRSARTANLVSSDDLATLIYTSGTTGKPKGVELTHGNLCSNVRASCQRYRFAPGDRSVAFLPWAHAFGQTAELFVLLWSGATIVINDDISRLAVNLRRFHPTVLVAVPRIFNRIYESTLADLEQRPSLVRRAFFAGLEAAIRLREERPRPGDALLARAADRLFFGRIREKLGGRLRFVISGSAALSPEVSKFISAVGVDVYEGYGMTEASPVVTSNYPGHVKMGSVGLPLSGVTVRIAPHPEAPPGEGEIIVSGPNVMRGYHGLPEESRRALLPDGSLRTGDMGRLDEEGYLFLTGRFKEQYKLENGKYVVPSPLEEQLKLSPVIEQVMIHGDGRPYNVALIVVDEAALSRRLGRTLTRAQASNDAEAQRLLEEELRAHGQTFRSYEAIRAFCICPGDFSQENGLLTPSLKVKRNAVLERYGHRLQALYP